MKKLGVAIATLSIFFTGIATMNVSAEEYEVQERDSLWSIAQKFDTSVQNLIDINGLDSTIIHPGQHITNTDKIEKEETSTTQSYIVKKGDTLSGSSSKYNINIEELMNWNDLSDSLILIGQEMKIKNTSQEKNGSKIEGKQNNKSEATEVANEPKLKQEAKTISVTATAYTAKCDGCSGITSTGIDLLANPDKKVIAVDPNVIPLGTKVYVEGYGKAVAGDIGGAIKGNKIDVHVPTKDEAKSWGVRTVDVTILN